MKENSHENGIDQPLKNIQNPKKASYAQVIDAILNSKSERYQDIFSLLFNNCKFGGYFVEFEACDRIIINNTYILEREFR